MSEEGRIVVGVDGSQASQEALRWAIGEARRRHCPVEAVEVWHYPALTYVPGVFNAPLFAHDDLEAGARAELDHVIHSVLGTDNRNGVDVRPVVREGAAVERLLDECKDASLLVLGSRGRGSFRGLLLGSVAQHCTAQARCPVVIVPDPEA